MPRMTRAQLKAQAEGTTQIHEDNESPSETGDASPDSNPARPILKDITAANIAAIESGDTLEIVVPKKTKAKKAGKKNAKNQKHNSVGETTLHVEELDDHDQSDNSDTTDTAVKSLLSEAGVIDPFMVTIDAARPQTPTSAELKEATNSLSPTKRTPAVARTPRFDPSEHTTPVMAQDLEQDSFVGTCQKASPFKLSMSQELRQEESDSFVEQIIARSPMKPMSRIEDSVDAIDALEEAIEQVAGELPVLGAEQLLSPTKGSNLELVPHRQSVKRKLATTSTPARSSSIKSLSSRASSTKLSSSKSPQKLPKSPLSTVSGSKKLSPQKSVTAAKPVVRVFSKSSAVRPSAAKSTTASASTQLAAVPQISFANSPAKPRANMTHKRGPGSILASSKAPFLPKPSSKPPTTSTFTLPGDAVAAKLKAEREERQKRMEAAERSKPMRSATIIKRTVSAEKKVPTAPSYQLPGDAVAAKLKAQREARLDREAGAEVKEKAKVFKARPAPTPRPSVAPRENKASTMRMSSIQRENNIKRRGSDKENMVPPTQIQAPNPKQRLEIKKIRNSIGGKIANPAVSRRSMNLSNQNVQERKAEPTVILSRAEKEDAARKARAEAAERGRLASREWAEKQKKKMEAGKVKSKREDAMEIAELMEVARMKGQVA